MPPDTDISGLYLIWTHMDPYGRRPFSDFCWDFQIDFPTCSTLAILRTLAASPHQGHGHGMTWTCWATDGDIWRPCLFRLSHPATSPYLSACHAFCHESRPPGGTKQLISLQYWKILEDFVTFQHFSISVSTFNFQLSTFNFLLRKGIALPHRPLALCYKVSYHQSDIRT